VKFGYPPIWLRLAFVGVGPAATIEIGLAEAVIFALSLAMLPVVRGRWLPAGLMLAVLLPACVSLLGPAQGLLAAAALLLLPIAYARWPMPVMMLAVISPCCVFGIERGNMDMPLFCITLWALALLHGGVQSRALGYGAVAIMAAMKYYPILLAGLALRERRAPAFCLIAIFTALTACFIWFFQADLHRSLANGPAPDAFALSFGAAQLPRGLAILLGWRGAFALVFAVASGLAVATTLWLASSAEFRAALASLTGWEADCLLGGAIIICGCFFAGPSILYRGVFLLLALPGLLRMAHPGAARGLTGLALRSAASVALLLMWIGLPLAMLQPGVGRATSASSMPFHLLWAVREVLWWWLVSMLAACALHLMARALPSPWWLPAWAGRRLLAADHVPN
jgi:hypothetical protein